MQSVGGGDTRMSTNYAQKSPRTPNSTVLGPPFSQQGIHRWIKVLVRSGSHERREVTAKLVTNKPVEVKKQPVRSSRLQQNQPIILEESIQMYLKLTKENRKITPYNWLVGPMIGENR